MTVVMRGETGGYWPQYHIITWVLGSKSKRWWVSIWMIPTMKIFPGNHGNKRLHDKSLQKLMECINKIILVVFKNVSVEHRLTEKIIRCTRWMSVTSQTELHLVMIGLATCLIISSYHLVGQNHEQILTILFNYSTIIGK